MKFFRHVEEDMKTMVDLLRKQQAPAQIMEMKRQKANKYLGVKPNDPCPCGSGKKFKKCHGRGL